MCLLCFQSEVVSSFMMHRTVGSSEGLAFSTGTTSLVVALTIPGQRYSLNNIGDCSCEQIGNFNTNLYPSRSVSNFLFPSVVKKSKKTLLRMGHTGAKNDENFSAHMERNGTKSHEKFL